MVTKTQLQQSIDAQKPDFVNSIIHLFDNGQQNPAQIKPMDMPMPQANGGAAPGVNYESVPKSSNGINIGDILKVVSSLVGGQ